jgi:predicted dithiol-disulfide oxidoreductase (DUF899 family)
VSNPANIRAWPAGASPRYVAARQRLLEAERDLLDRVKRVAELRQALPPGAAMPPYTFAEGPPDLTRDHPVAATTLAELVGDRGLFVYHMMFASDWDHGCPSCSMWVDGLHGVAHHLAQVTNLAVIAKAPLPKLRAWARRRGWSGLRLLSSHGTSFNADVGAEDADGGQWPRASVFVRRDGVVYHHYSTAMLDNGLDLLTPVWHVQDLLPQGRGDWEPSNTCAGPASPLPGQGVGALRPGSQ